MDPRLKRLLVLLTVGVAGAALLSLLLWTQLAKLLLAKEPTAADYRALQITFTPSEIREGESTFLKIDGPDCLYGREVAFLVDEKEINKFVVGTARKMTPAYSTSAAYRVLVDGRTFTRYADVIVRDAGSYYPPAPPHKSLCPEQLVLDTSFVVSDEAASHGGRVLAINHDGLSFFLLGNPAEYPKNVIEFVPPSPGGSVKVIRKPFDPSGGELKKLSDKYGFTERARDAEIGGLLSISVEDSETTTPAPEASVLVWTTFVNRYYSEYTEKTQYPPIGAGFISRSSEEVSFVPDLRRHVATTAGGKLIDLCAGYILAVPEAWQQELSATVLIGRTGSLPGHRAGYGPIAWGVGDPADEQDLRPEEPLVARPYLLYTYPHPLVFSWNHVLRRWPDEHQVTGGAILQSPDGRASLVYVGEVGACDTVRSTAMLSGDLPINADEPKTTYHAGRVEPALFFFDLQDLVEIRKGAKTYRDVKPYAVVPLLPYLKLDSAEPFRLGGVCSDFQGSKLYVVQRDAEEKKYPEIHVLSVID